MGVLDKIQALASDGRRIVVPLIDPDRFNPAIVDSLVFKEKNVKVKKLKDYPIDAIYGKKLKAPKEMSDVRSLVTSDYQELLERNWVAELRKKYPVEVYDEVVKTVNNH